MTFSHFHLRSWIAWLLRTCHAPRWMCCPLEKCRRSLCRQGLSASLLSSMTTLKFRSSSYSCFFLLHRRQWRTSSHHAILLQQWSRSLCHSADLVGSRWCRLWPEPSCSWRDVFCQVPGIRRSGRLTSRQGLQYRRVEPYQCQASSILQVLCFYHSSAYDFGISAEQCQEICYVKSTGLWPGWRRRRIGCGPGRTFYQHWWNSSTTSDSPTLSCADRGRMTQHQFGEATSRLLMSMHPDTLPLW